MPDANRTRSTFLRADVPSPFCADCGHLHSVSALDKALVELGLDPRHVVIVSDTGCIGALDTLFSSLHTVHAIHGRAAGIGTGIALTDAVLHDAKLKTVVVLGDGAAMAALPHIADAARLNVDVTVLVANNFLLGMSGGQSSSLSPQGFQTAGAPEGCLFPALDLCAVVQQYGGAFVARALATADDLPDLVSQAVRHSGFAFVEIVEVCSAHVGGDVRLGERRLIEWMQQLNRPTGCLAPGGDRPAFGALYGARQIDASEAPEAGIKPSYRSPLKGSMQWVIAGTATEPIDWTGQVLMRAAVMAGLHGTQRTSRAVTPGAGFVVTELCLSHERVGYAGVTTPHVIVIASHAGFDEIEANGTLARAREHTLVCAEDSLPAFGGPAEILRLPFRELCTPHRAAIAGVLAAVEKQGMVPAAAIFEAIEQLGESADGYRDDVEKLRTVRRG